MVTSYRSLSLLLAISTLCTMQTYTVQPDYRPDNTVFVFDFDQVILSKGLTKRRKTIDLQTVAIMKALKTKGYRLDGGTNNSQANVRYYQKKFRPVFIDLITKTKAIGSGDKKKPHDSFFQAYLQEYAPKNKKHFIFIDDKKKNCEAAEKNGFKSIHFKSPSQLYVELKKMNIL